MAFLTRLRLIWDVLRVMSQHPLQHVPPPDGRLVVEVRPCRSTPDCTVYVYAPTLEVVR